MEPLAIAAGVLGMPLLPSVCSLPCFIHFCEYYVQKRFLPIFDRHQSTSNLKVAKSTYLHYGQPCIRQKFLEKCLGGSKTLSLRKFISYKNQSIDLQSKSGPVFSFIKKELLNDKVMELDDILTKSGKDSAKPCEKLITKFGTINSCLNFATVVIS